MQSWGSKVRPRKWLGVESFSVVWSPLETEPLAMSGLSALVPVEPTDSPDAAARSGFSTAWRWVGSGLPLSRVTLQACRLPVAMAELRELSGATILTQQDP